MLERYSLETAAKVADRGVWEKILLPGVGIRRELHRSTSFVATLLGGVVENHLGTLGLFLGNRVFISFYSQNLIELTVTGAYGDWRVRRRGVLKAIHSRFASLSD